VNTHILQTRRILRQEGSIYSNQFDVLMHSLNTAFQERCGMSRRCKVTSEGWGTSRLKTWHHSRIVETGGLSLVPRTSVYQGSISRGYTLV
jgi:hypothetical protein